VKGSYELVIIGGGPAGLTAGLYAARARIRTLLIERAVVGGQIANAELLENYPGFPDGISGFELGLAMQKQAKKYGLEIMAAEVTGLEVIGGEKVVRSSEGDFGARAVIIAGGSEHSRLGVPGEEELVGRGVSYCATCDGALFRDQVVAVVGGGNAAVVEALFLTRFAEKVVVIHRRDQLRATRILQERALASPKIEFRWDSVVERVEGEGRLKELVLRNVKSGEISRLEVSGTFVAIGLRPNTSYLDSVVDLDSGGFVVVNERMETSVPGVFAAGDIRANSARQAVSAAGDGATAALAAERFLGEAT